MSRRRGGRGVVTALVWPGIVPIAVLAAAAGAAPAGAERLSPEALAELTLVDVPLVLDAVDTTGRTGQLWASGNEPANTLIARLTLKPVEAVVTRPEAGSEVTLWRAFTGGGVTRLAASALSLDTVPRRYCGIPAAGQPPACFSDDDGDGTLDRIAPASLERGARPYLVTLARGFAPLPRPLPYSPLPAAERPAITVRLANCAKDYDRPRFSAQAEGDRSDPVFTGGFTWHDKDSSFAICRRGRALEALEGQTPPPGRFLAQLGPLAVTVGPRQAPALAVLGPVDGDALYRIEGATLVDLRVGPTPLQAEVVARKKFPLPVLVSDPGATLERGSIAPGGVIARVPFHHAYRARLVEPVEIRTLLGKRALPAGTVLYGYPARRALRATINGSPVGEAVREDALRRIDVSLTWCTPVRGDPPKQENDRQPGRGGWSAACIPQSQAGTYTILTDRQPALAVDSLSYDVATSSNPGTPPVERQDGAVFDRPLRIEYLFQSHQADSITLRENLYFGDELTSSTPQAVYAPDGVARVVIAAVPVTLTRRDDGTISAEPGGSAAAGSDARLEWDREAMLRSQLGRMGLRLEPAGDGAAPAQLPAPAP